MVRDTDRLILRNFIPVVIDGKTVAMLYGVVDLETLPARLDVSAYGGQASIYFADGTTGDFIVDTWHNSLGNVTEMSGRTVKRGYSSSQLQEDFLAGKTGHCVFVSKSIGGDEFVALVCDCPLDDIIAKLEQINAALNEQSYHVSIGLSREDRSPIQTEALIKQSEFHMYEEKQRYYEESGAGSCRLPAQP